MADIYRDKIKDTLKTPRFLPMQKTTTFWRLLRYLPIKLWPDVPCIDDRDTLEDAELVRIDWPSGLPKPRVGLIKDPGPYPQWTKFRRFLENNDFPYEIYDIHAHDWQEKATSLDVIVGFPMSVLWWLQEVRQKYHFLERYMGKFTYPSPAHADLYEDKELEVYILNAINIPLAKTFISHNREDALDQVSCLKYPLISKIVPGSGSVGVEMVKTPAKARKIINQAFSNNGRKTHMAVFRQKNYVLFQEFIPNDGYDIRVIMSGDRAFGYYRKVRQGDFRASGMNHIEWRELPAEALRITRQVYKIIHSPLLVMDFVHGLDGKYYTIEFSPICLLDTPVQLEVNGVGGDYVFDDELNFHFQEGRWWTHELALREFFLNTYLPKVRK